MPSRRTDRGIRNGSATSTTTVSATDLRSRAAWMIVAELVIPEFELRSRSRVCVACRTASLPTSRDKPRLGQDLGRRVAAEAVFALRRDEVHEPLEVQRQAGQPSEVYSQTNSNSGRIGSEADRRGRWRCRCYSIPSRHVNADVQEAGGQVEVEVRAGTISSFLSGANAYSSCSKSPPISKLIAVTGPKVAC